MKLLCCGDLHIGRRSSRVPDDVEGRRFSCAAALEAVVRLAVEEQVDAVLFAGDVIERSNRYFEAVGPLERGLLRLARERIPVCAVAGNHDFDVLDRVAASPGADAQADGGDAQDGAVELGLRLLGRGGRWERALVRGRDGSEFLVDGWSFPREHFATSPLDDYDPAKLRPRPAGRPVVGLLHADLDQLASRYAPTSSERLRERPVAAWVVGHVHKPSVRAGEGAFLLVPGSVQALGLGEPGPHGPWVLTLERLEETRVAARQVPLSSARYDRVVVDLASVEDEAELERRVVAAIRSHRDEVLGSPGAEALAYLGCTVRFTGRTPLHSVLSETERRLLDDLDLARDGVRVRVERVERQTRPAFDLDDVARSHDPAGILARALRDLERGAAAEVRDELEELLRDGTAAAVSVHRSRPYEPLDADPEPDDAATRDLLLSQGYVLLDALLAQKERA